MSGWSMRVPRPEYVVPQPPPYSASNYPLGTVASRDGSPDWYVVWDNQDKCHRWSTKNEDI